MLRPEITTKLFEILGETNVLIKKEHLYNYAIDHSTGKISYPLCVVKPADTYEVSKVVAFCNEIGQGITCRAGGSGVSGGTIANPNDIVLSVERLNQIEEVNTIDRYVIAGAGVITQNLQDELAVHGLWFPQNISSSAISCIGGNVAVSSGSPKSLKYGSTKNFVLNLQVVLPNGQVIWTGKNIKKNATGYNLTQLFVGSEGTLGIITKVVFELRPPEQEILLRIPFSTESSLFSFLHHFFLEGYSASSLEFLDSNGYHLMHAYLKKSKAYPIDRGGVLWIEIESESESENQRKIALLWDFISEYTESEILVAQSKTEITKLWEYRKKIGEAALNYSNFKDLDIVVPRSKIAPMYRTIKSICKAEGLHFVVVGHIGNGNFHVNIFRNSSLGMHAWEEKIAYCSKAIFEKAVALGGEISGEHGVGKYNTLAMDFYMDPEKVQLMRQIKEVFDPNNILNPNTIFLKKKAQANYRNAF
ncbi:MAG: FAD-binding oxidoreductase [Bacteroidota bacterium]